MRPVESKRAEEVFAAALDLEPTRRPAYLDQACADDPALRREVESLLASYDSADSFLESPAVGLLTNRAEVVDDDSSLIGSTIGGYRVVRLVGAGGMGRVYESEQGSPRRTVALKLIKGALASSTAKRRFEYEAEILARLHHPGIAQIYEAGVHESDTGSLPFFAMEYVANGRTILDHARGERLSLHQRLMLFAVVCDAVHHGHQKGVIHRDLKPGNILVDPVSGSPKIIDFGVARVMRQDSAVTTVTRLGELVGTLQYMSPEQCTEDPQGVDTRSDVYSLGVVLFELLTGERPYDLAGKPIPEAVRIIQEQSPRRPSSINRHLRGEVETILLKALEKDPKRRYASAADFAQDIRRHLASEPIEAHPPSAMYQFRKFVSRYRLPAALAALLFVSVSALAVATTILSSGLRAERDEAEKEMRTVQRIAEFQKDMLTAAAPRVAQGRDVTVREVLDEAAGLIGESLADEPEVASAMHDTIGQSYYALGRYEEAEAQYLAAIELRKQVFGEADPRTLNSKSNLAILYVDMGRHEEALSLYDDVIELQRQQLGEAHTDTVVSSLNYAHLLDVVGRRRDAIGMLEEIVEICRQSFEHDSRERLGALNSLAVMYAKEGDYAAAAPYFEEAYDLQQDTLGPDHPNTLVSMNNLARLYEHTDRLDEAVTMMNEVIERRSRVLGEDHPQTIASRSFLGGMMSRAERYADAEAILREVLEERAAMLRADHPDTLQSAQEYAEVLQKLGRWQDAEPLLRETLAGAEAKYPDGHERVSGTAIVLGRNLMAMDRHEEALEYLIQGFEMDRDLRGLGHKSTQEDLVEVIACCEALGDQACAEEYRAMLAANEDDSAP